MKYEHQYSFIAFIFKRGDVKPSLEKADVPCSVQELRQSWNLHELGRGGKTF